MKSGNPCKPFFRPLIFFKGFLKGFYTALVLIERLFELFSPVDELFTDPLLPEAFAKEVV